MIESRNRVYPAMKELLHVTGVRYLRSAKGGNWLDVEKWDGDAQEWRLAQQIDVCVPVYESHIQAAMAAGDVLRYDPVFLDGKMVAISACTIPPVGVGDWVYC